MDENPLVRFSLVMPAIEFSAWTMAVLIPLLQLINGLAVTRDQFRIQLTIFVGSLIVALGFRASSFWHSRRE